MTEIERLLNQIRRINNCTVVGPSGMPVLREGDRLPADVLDFYTMAGGVRLFEDSDYPMNIVGPDEFTRTNPVILQSEYPDDITDFWYIIARSGRDECLSIDCGIERNGRCYDSFWDSHGVAGSCAVVAQSFTELLERLFRSGGGYWYWLAPDAPGYGDAYGR